MLEDLTVCLLTGDNIPLFDTKRQAFFRHHYNFKEQNYGTSFSYSVLDSFDFDHY
jgi:hypothetical protein